MWVAWPSMPRQSLKTDMSPAVRSVAAITSFVLTLIGRPKSVAGDAAAPGASNAGGNVVVVVAAAPVSVSNVYGGSNGDASKDAPPRRRPASGTRTAPRAAPNSGELRSDIAVDGRAERRETSARCALARVARQEVRRRLHLFGPPSGWRNCGRVLTSRGRHNNATPRTRVTQDRITKRDRPTRSHKAWRLELRRT